RNEFEIACGLGLIGLFAAIYHPVGIPMVVTHARAVGHTLAVNGVFGNLGLAFAAVVTGALTEAIGWGAAFILPGIVSVAAGIAFALLVPAGNGEVQHSRQVPEVRVSR